MKIKNILFKRKNKKGMMPILIILAILSGIGALVTLGFLDLPASIFGQEEIWQANWGTMKCKESPKAEEENYRLSIPQTIYCGVKENVEECKIYIKCEDAPWYKSDCVGRYRECDSFGKNCKGWELYNVRKNTEEFEDFLKSKRSYQFDRGLLTAKGEDRTIIRKEFNLWKLWGEEFGRDFLANSQGCRLPYTIKDQVEAGGKRNDLTCIEKGQLTFDDSCRVVNYITHWAPATGNVVNCKGHKTALCQARELFEIDTFVFADKSMKQIQGKSLGFVECCPNEPNCGSDCKISFVEPDECRFDYQCMDGGRFIPIDANSVKQQTCVNGKCEWQSSKIVECTTDSECRRIKGTGFVCSGHPGWKCKEGDPTPFICGDGICNELEGENIDTCPEDCSCPDGEILQKRVFKEDCLIGFPLNIGCKEVVEEKCVKIINWNFYIKWFGIILLIIIAIYIFLPYIIGVLSALRGMIGI